MNSHQRTVSTAAVLTVAVAALVTVMMLVGTVRPATVRGGEEAVSAGTTAMAAPSSKEDIRAWCAEGGIEERDCEFRYFTDYTNANGVPRALAAIETLRADPEFLPLCHHSLHGVGQAAPALLGVPEALKLSVGYCQAGYIHGVLQTWTTMTTEAEANAQADQVCSPLHGDAPHASTFEMFCGHGLGHALAIHNPSSINKVADICGELTYVNSACLEGAIMEFGGSDHVTLGIKAELGSAPTESLTTEQRTELCNMVKDNMAGRCWQKIFMLWGDAYQDPALFMSRCDKAAQPEWQDLCARSWGEVLTIAGGVTLNSSDEDIRELVSGCDLIDPADAGPCLYGLLEVLWRDTPVGAPGRTTVCDVLGERWREHCEGAEAAVLDIRENA